MADSLTYEQRLAVENRGGKLLVSAAAGSGKTKVLVDRLMSYIMDPSDPANIDDFLIITYTKAAASELRGKIASKLSELIATGGQNRHLQQQMQRLYLAKISTVHAFCTDILRQYAYRLDISSDFRVADEQECLELQIKVLDHILDSAYATAENNPEFCAFINSQGLGRDDRQIPEIILKVYHSAICHSNPMQWLQWCISASNTADISDASQTPWGQYLILDLHQYLDFQIQSLENCITSAVNISGLEKPVALLGSTVSQLQILRDSATWDEIIAHKDIDYGRLTIPKSCSDLQFAEQLKAVRNACKDGVGKRLKNFSDCSDQIIQDMGASLSAEKGLVWLVKQFMTEYESSKRKLGILDFADLEHKTLDLFLGKTHEHPTAVAAEVGERFREIMVDEYQDSNGIQDAIFASLTSKRQNCFMVGDVKQSIYQFRLADPGIFLQKYQTYIPAENAQTGEGRKIMLSKNFRSSNGVIQGVNDVFTRCMSQAVGGIDYGTDEMMREGIPHVPLNEPEVSLYGIEVDTDTYAEEASFVADKICSLLDGTHYVRNGDVLRPIRPEDIVILLRSPGSVGAEFQWALQCRGIRCITGDSANLLDADEISTVISLLQVIDNPLQDIPLAVVLTSPVFGYTAEDLALLRSTNRQADLFKLLSKIENDQNTAFMDLLQKFRKTSKLLTSTQLLAQIYSETNLLSIYGAMPDGEERLNNLQNFFQIVSNYETSGPKQLGRLLDYLESCKEKGLVISGAQQESGAVTIMSIHKSKGLEFPVVFLCGLSRSFNQESARNQVLCDKDLGLGLSCVETKHRVRYPSIAKRAISSKMIQESISEELRVLYVAMTRARDRLIMTYAVKNLEKDLQDLAMRLDLCNKQLMTMDVDCPGLWVLQSALMRTEAGAFFELGGHPNCAKVHDSIWEIAVVQGTNTVSLSEDQTSESATSITNALIEKLREDIQFRYMHHAATNIPSKLTATQLKGRELDVEVSEGAGNRKKLDFRKPGIQKTIGGISYGNAMHKTLQFIRFQPYTCTDDVRKEVDRMVHERLISPEQAEMVDCEKLAVFFATDLGRKLQNNHHVLREFKFSLLDDAGKYYADIKDEQILLQGVVDCAIIEEDGITVLDFKTDRVTESSLQTTAEKYFAQVKIYATALERIYQLPVKNAKLYFFAVNQFVDVM